MSECQASTSAQHQCDTCHKTFSKERYLRRHCRLVHVEDQRATCQFCNKQICKSNLKRHEDLVHREIKTYTCNDCQTQYGTKEQLDSHKLCPNFIVITVTNQSHILATWLNQKNSSSAPNVERYSCQAGICGHMLRTYMKRDRRLYVMYVENNLPLRRR